MTGSDEKSVLCLEEGSHATTTYGVQVYTYGGTCLVCRIGIQIVLDFNSMTGYYYARCPICNTVWRHLNPDGSLSDFQIVNLGKNPALENMYSENEPQNSW